MSATDFYAVPPAWRSLVASLGGRIPDGTDGIRDVDAPCEAFKPAGAPYERAKGTGSCETDGHYICVECVEIKLETLRRRQDQCEECGASLVKVGYLEQCPACCDLPGGGAT